MGLFGRREKTFEEKYAHDEELKFKILARRAALLGSWAASLLGLTGDAADQYSQGIIELSVAEAGDEPLFRRLRADFDAKGLKITDRQIRRQMQDLLQQATAEIEKKG